MPKTDAASVAATAAQRLAQQMGYEFVDAALEKENGSSFLRVYIDHDQGLTIERLEAFHHALNPYVENVQYDYLEVCSPGIDRPLKRARDFDRAAGKDVEVRLYKAVDRTKRFAGKLIKFENDIVVIQTGAGEMGFKLSDCALVRQTVDFERLKEE